MLCSFTTEHGALIIRSDDIRSIADGPSHTVLQWDMCGELFNSQITGSASENAARIAQDELDMIGRVEAHRFATQQQLQAGYPVPPVKRGR